MLLKLDIRCMQCYVNPCFYYGMPRYNKISVQYLLEEISFLNSGSLINTNNHLPTLCSFGEHNEKTRLAYFDAVSFTCHRFEYALREQGDLERQVRYQRNCTCRQSPEHEGFKTLMRRDIERLQRGH
jgi:hypothetical protein